MRTGMVPPEEPTMGADRIKGRATECANQKPRLGLHAGGSFGSEELVRGFEITPGSYGHVEEHEVREKTRRMRGDTWNETRHVERERNRSRVVLN